MPFLVKLYCPYQFTLIKQSAVIWHYRRSLMGESFTGFAVLKVTLLKYGEPAAKENLTVITDYI